MADRYMLVISTETEGDEERFRGDRYLEIVEDYSPDNPFSQHPTEPVSVIRNAKKGGMTFSEAITEAWKQIKAVS